MNSLPDVVSPRAFILTLPFLLFYICIAKRSTERVKSKQAGRKQNMEIIVLLALGIIFIALMLLLLLPITRAENQLLGWLFSWFCGHGWPAVLVARICRNLWRAKTTVNRRNEPAKKM